MIFITGASSGIGKETALEFARDAKINDALFLVARRMDKLEELKKRIHDECPEKKVMIANVDLADEKSLLDFFNHYEESLKKCRVLVQNAGLALGLDSMEKMPFDFIQKMIQTNVSSVFQITKLLIPFLKKNHQNEKPSHVFFLGSIAGRYPYLHGNVYGATKAAILSFSQSLRYELSGSGVRVTEIAPGMVETEFSEVRFQGDLERSKAVYQGLTPLHAIDIARSIHFCLQQPGHVNIQELVIYPTSQVSPYLCHRDH